MSTYLFMYYMAGCISAKIEELSDQCAGVSPETVMKKCTFGQILYYFDQLCTKGGKVNV